MYKKETLKFEQEKKKALLDSNHQQLGPIKIDKMSSENCEQKLQLVDQHSQEPCNNFNSLGK